MVWRRLFAGNSCLVDLNDNFAKLCSDDLYIEPTPVTISSEVEILVISERQIWNSLRALKRTAAGPHPIPCWVWKEHAWFGISQSPLSVCYHRGSERLSPLFPKRMFLSINMTPVIARTLEKIAYHCHARETIAESHLSTSLFVYRKGGNCTDTFLSIPHRIKIR